MGCAHHKRHVPAGLTDPRDDEERIEDFGGCSSAPAGV